MSRIPEAGRSAEEVRESLERFTEYDFNVRSGRAFGYTFDAGEEAERVGREAFNAFMGKNALDPTFFPSVLRLENEVVSMAARHLGGDEETVGAFTSGGTESIILAVKASRDYMRSVRPDIGQPEMVLPVTAHAAFHKAGHYLGVRPVSVDVDPVTFQPDPEDMERAISPRTILMVGSASCYGNGVVDPIPELGRVALENGLLLHVDGCIGGFLLPYFKRFGEKFPDFDFTVPGVTSISMDLHKYAYAHKGSSTVLFKNRDLRRHMIFAFANWTGYTMVNTTIQSTKSAGPLASSWAVLTFLGDDGYTEIARRLLDARDKLLEGIPEIPQFQLVGRPVMPLVAFTSEQINVFQVIDRMRERGWYIQPALRLGRHRENIHLSVNPNNVPQVDALLSDLREVAGEIKDRPGGRLATIVSNTFGRMNPDRLDDAVFDKIISIAGMSEVGVPEDMADINDIMNALPPRLAERLLQEYINRLFVAPGARVSKPTVKLPTGPPRDMGEHGGSARGDGAGPRLPAWADTALTRRALALVQRVRRRLP